MKINIFWFRRDLRLDDNTALINALSADLPVLPVFIFDTSITGELPADDPRVSFIYETLSAINLKLSEYSSSMYVIKDDPFSAWTSILRNFEIEAVYFNRDYEPYAIERDSEITALLAGNDIKVYNFKDQVIFETNEILKSDGSPYTVFTPYKNKWLEKFANQSKINEGIGGLKFLNFVHSDYHMPSLEMLGFKKSQIIVRPFDLSVIASYDKYRDLPAADLTSYLSPHLRFGTVSIRKVIETAGNQNQVFLSELIWREFFMQILYHFPKVVTGNFRSKYDDIKWRNDESDFERWCNGDMGYPIVDAGMHHLNQTGYMHNRVRMITASFLCKHLLIDWRWGEGYFAQKLLDYELSSNNGNWQWAAGTGCDAAPYFRIFNPEIQQKKFDPQKEYIMRWVENAEKTTRRGKIVEHDFARMRALSVYKSGIRN